MVVGSRQGIQPLLEKSTATHRTLCNSTYGHGRERNAWEARSAVATACLAKRADRLPEQRVALGQTSS